MRSQSNSCLFLFPSSGAHISLVICGDHHLVLVWPEVLAHLLEMTALFPLGKCSSPTPWILERRGSTQPSGTWPRVSHMTQLANQDFMGFVLSVVEKEVLIPLDFTEVRWGEMSNCRLFLVTSDLLCFGLCGRRADSYVLMIVFLEWQGVYLLLLPWVYSGNSFWKIEDFYSWNFQNFIFPFQNTAISSCFRKRFEIKLRFYDRLLFPQLLWLR